MGSNVMVALLLCVTLQPKVLLLAWLNNKCYRSVVTTDMLLLLFLSFYVFQQITFKSGIW